jgi:uncharacterized membrane protein/V8-like Glu-specific endopeptidase
MHRRPSNAWLLLHCAAALVLASAPAKTQVPPKARTVEFCNHTPEPARAAVGYELPTTRQRLLEGWTRIWPGECAKHAFTAAAESPVFTYVEAGKNRWEGSVGSHACIRDDAFQNPLDSPCAAGSRKITVRTQPADYAGSVLRDPHWPQATLAMARVLGIQAALLKSGAFVGMTGVLDAQTRAALKQRGIPLNASGPKLWARFGESPAPTRVAASPPASVPPTVGTEARAGTSERRIEMCNATLETIRAAIGYLESSSPDKWMAQGWMILAPGGCASRTVRAVTASGLYGYAQGKTVQWDLRKNPLAVDFCVGTSETFALPADHAACSTPDKRIAWFELAKSSGEPRVWTPTGAPADWTLEKAGVKARQVTLARLGLYGGKIDGIANDELRRGLDAFSRIHKTSTDLESWLALSAAVERHENYAYLLTTSPGDAAAPLAPPSLPVPVRSVCTATPIKYADFTGGYKYPRLAQEVVGNFWDELAAARDSAHTASVSRALRECLDKTLAKVRANPYQLLDGGYRVSELMPEGAHLLMLEALSYLYSPNRADQNPLAAAELVRQAFAEYKAASEGAQKQLVARYEELEQKYLEARRKEDERFRKDQRNTMISAVIGGFLLHKYADAPADVVSTTVHNMYDSMERFRELQLEQVEHLGDIANGMMGRALTIEPPSTWTDDGVRLHVVRFASELGAHGAAQRWQDHTRLLVRILSKSVSCTGALVGPRLVLTAQHCVYDEFGKPFGPMQVRWEYFQRDSKRGIVNAAKVVNVTRWQTGRRHWKQGWDYDWALLELDAPIAKDWGYLTLLPPEELAKTPGRISIAGYSGDIDHGEFITMDWGCAVRDSKLRGVLEHACKTWSGASGSPVIVSEGPFKSRIVAVHSFGRHSEGRHGGGPSVSQFYDTWRSMLASQKN